MMTLKQVELVQDTVRQLSFKRECFATMFDARLSTIDPELARRVNARHRDTSLELVALLHLAVSALAWPVGAEHMIQLLLKPYLQCQLSKRHLAHLRQSWLHALQECLSAKFTDEAAQAWVSAIDMVEDQLNKDADQARIG